MIERTETLRMELTYIGLALSAVHEASKATPPDLVTMESAITSAVQAMERAQKIVQEVCCDIQAKLDAL